MCTCYLIIIHCTCTFFNFFNFILLSGNLHKVINYYVFFFSKIHEMALNHEVHSAKHEGNLRNAMSNLDSTITQLEAAETSNTQLQQKVSSVWHYGSHSFEFAL